MIKTSCGLMTPMEAKIIGDIDRDLKNAVTLPIKKRSKNGKDTHSTKVHDR